MSSITTSKSTSPGSDLAAGSIRQQYRQDAVVQQTSAAVQFSDSWATATASAYSGGSTRTTNADRASAAYTFTGRSIALVSTKTPLRGKGQIYVNGMQVGTLYPYAATTTYRVVIWQQTWSTSATRTVQMVVIGPTGRPRADLDAFAVLE